MIAQVALLIRNSSLLREHVWMLVILAFTFQVLTVKNVCQLVKHAPPTIPAIPAF